MFRFKWQNISFVNVKNDSDYNTKKEIFLNVYTNDNDGSLKNDYNF